MTSLRILVFGRDASIRNELVDLLPPTYPVTHLTTVDELREALQAQNILMLVCTDVTIPVLVILKQSGHNIPLVCVTREAMPISLTNTLLDLNLRAIIQYPFKVEDMHEIVTNALEWSYRHEQNEHLEANLAHANQQLNQRLQEINTIYTVGKFVTSSLHVDEVLERIVDVSVNLTQAEEGFILLREGEKLYLRIAKDMNEQIAQRFYVEASDPIAWQVIRSGRPTMLDRNTKIATGYLVRSLLYVPLQVAGQGTIGVLGIVNLFSNRSFTEHHLFTLSSIADYAAIALENARLFGIVDEEHSRLSAILEHAAEAILVTDAENRLWLWSDSAATNFDLGPDAQGQKIEQHIGNAAICDLFSRAGDSGTVLHAEVELGNGRVYNVQLSSINHIGRVVVMQDITHLKELNRLKSEFVSTVSHDLRTPLTTVQGYIELLERVGPLSERQTAFIDKALSSLDQITALITDLLDIGRIEAGYDELEMQSCCINDILQQTAETHTIQAEAQQLHLHVETPDQPLWIQCNTRRMRQVMDNLVNNAIKYSRPDGWVKLAASADGDHVSVSIEDNGIGIPLEEQPKIFERFYRVQGPETRSIHGTGLGLAIVKSVIEKHGGHIWLQSYPGKGSTFGFVLPMSQPSPPAEPDISIDRISKLSRRLYD